MKDISETMKVGVVQAPPVFMDKGETTRRVVEFINEGGDRGIELLVFPEGFIPTHPMWYHFYPATGPDSIKLAKQLFINSVEVPGDETRAIAIAARNARMSVVLGVCEREANTTGTLYNSLLFFDAERGLVGRHRKLAPTTGERLVHTGGDSSGLRSFGLSGRPVSGLMCGENSNPFAIAALGNYGVQIHAASWPGHFSLNKNKMPDVIDVASRALAYRMSCFVLSAASVIDDEMVSILARTDEDRTFLTNYSNLGGSVIVGPDSNVVAGPAKGDFTGILEAELDLSDCIAAKVSHDYFGHYNRKDIFELRVNSTPTRLLTVDDHRDRAPRSSLTSDFGMSYLDDSDLDEAEQIDQD